MTDATVHCDTETRSTIDLRKVGKFVYSAHPSTDCITMSYAFGDGPIRRWRPGQPVDREFAAHISAGGIVTCHNYGFEYSIFKDVLSRKHGWPAMTIRQGRCTATMAAAMSLPRALGDAARAVGLSIEKDAAGHRLMLQMCKPRGYNPDGSPIWWDDADRVERLSRYCDIDVEVERALEKRLRPLRPQEQELWFLDQVINERGIYLDIQSIEAGIGIADKETRRINREIDKLTRKDGEQTGAVTASTQVAKIVEWLKTVGIEMESLGKEAVKSLLEAHGDLLTPDAKRLLELRLLAAKSSVKKFDAMRKRRQADGRARENFMFHGAGTGRWTGVGIQFQNLVRETPKDAEAVFDAVRTGDPEMVRCFHGEPMHVLASCCRGMVVAPQGKTLTTSDFSNVEGRGIAWLAGEKQKVDAFRAFDAGVGPELYKVTASRVLGIPLEAVTPEQRQSSGKVPELACGYGGGVGAFQNLAKVYGVKVTDEKADEIKTAWRLANPAIVHYWWDLEEAAMSAVAVPGRITSVRGSDFKVAGGVLWLRLPSGRCLAYPDPLIKDVETPWGEMKPSVTYMGVDQKTRQWSRQKSYGGKWSENITQAIARDLMAEAMFRVEAAGYPIVMHAHDELVAETDEAFGSLKEFNELMEVVPAWAKGFPLKAAGWRGRRYRK